MAWLLAEIVTRMGIWLAMEKLINCLIQNTYKVKFVDGCIQEYLANTVAERVHALVDTEGDEYVIL